MYAMGIRGRPGNNRFNIWHMFLNLYLYTTLSLILPLCGVVLIAYIYGLLIGPRGRFNHHPPSHRQQTIITEWHRARPFIVLSPKISAMMRIHSIYARQFGQPKIVLYNTNAAGIPVSRFVRRT